MEYEQVEREFWAAMKQVQSAVRWHVVEITQLRAALRVALRALEAYEQGHTELAMSEAAKLREALKGVEL